MIFIIETVLYNIWFSRNQATFHNNIVTYTEIVKKCKNDIRYRLLVDKQRLSKNMFNTAWNISNFLRDIYLELNKIQTYL